MKHNFEIKKLIDEVPRESISHEVDHVRTLPNGAIALEIEWNNKDPFFDRDLENFKRLHGEGAISVGVLITRGRANLPAYQAVGGISGQIKSVGSDTLNNEMALWAKGFEGLYSGVEIEIEGKGSATAPPALVEGASQFGPMSRPMSADEVAAFEKKYGYKPVHFRVAVDALAVYVNKDNPD